MASLKSVNVGSSSTTTTTTTTTTKITDNGKTVEEVHIIDQPWTFSNWHQHINWLNTTIIVGTPLIGIYGLLTTKLTTPTLIWAIIYYFLTGFGITVGYHRLWAHRSYTASLPLRVALAAFGGGAVEGSIRWWSRDHRAHHRYTDTAKDPYSVRKGLVYAHLGWMIIKQDPKKIGRTDISDLNADPLVRWQHKNYLLVVAFMGYLFPMIVAGLGWGDWRGGFFYAGVCRLVFVHHATFCVNSLAHYLGDQPFDDRHSPRDHVLTAFVTLGEGYHNMHHEFPSDFRNALKWYQYDPSKWLIMFCYYFGLASKLQRFPQNEIEKGRLQQRQKKLDRERTKLDWGIPVQSLPVIEFEEFQAECEKGRSLILVAGIAHDVSAFIKHHPGGEALIRSGIKKDMTAAFNGGVYDHSNAAHNLLSTMRVAVVRGGGEVEAWKNQNVQGKDIYKDTTGQDIVRAGMQATRVSVPLGAAQAI